MQDVDKLQLAIRLIDDVRLSAFNPHTREFLTEAVPLITRAIRHGWTDDEVVESWDRVAEVALP